MSGTASSLLSAAASFATAALEPAGSSLVEKVATVAGKAEGDVQTFLNHNVALSPIVNDLVSLAVSQGEQHEPMITSLFLQLAQMLAGMPAAIVHVNTPAPAAEPAKA